MFRQEERDYSVQQLMFTFEKKNSEIVPLFCFFRCVNARYVTTPQPLPKNCMKKIAYYYITIICLDEMYLHHL